MLHCHSLCQEQTRYESLHSLTLSLFRCTILSHYTTGRGGRIKGDLTDHACTVRAQ